MLSNAMLVIFYVVIFQNIQIDGQLCTETNMTWREVPETYTYTYMEAYEKTNCLFWCTDSRVATAVGTRLVKKQVPEQITICCQGFKEEKSSSDNGFYCIPVCSAPCVNGFCKSPEECACNPGYLPDILEPNNCTAMCIKDCEHGTCVAPNTCECDFGYKLIDRMCEPICQKACDNGICIAPNTCQCHPGYKKSEYGICEPFCSNYTASGECVVTVICEPGWEKDMESPIETCKPICTKPCSYGKCISPDLCECFQGYQKSILDICEPYCSSECLNGICMSPELCVCKNGFYKKESDGACIPHCDFACGNGTCVAPNICECLPGYVYVSNLLEDKARNNLCVPLCENCEGSCVDPEDCICEWPWEPVSISSDGYKCDCLDNCSVIGQKCEYTVCLLFTIPEYVTNGTNEFVSDPGDILDFDDNENLDNFEVHYNKKPRYNLKWLYGLGGLCMILIVVIIAVILKKRRTKSLNSPRSNDNDVPAVVHYKQSSFL